MREDEVMPSAAYSPECYDGMCSACRYEDCGCPHHLCDVLNCDTCDDEMDPDDNDDFRGFH